MVTHPNPDQPVRGTRPGQPVLASPLHTSGPSLLQEGML